MIKIKNPWKTVKRNILYHNKYGYALRDDDVINPGGKAGKYMVLESGGHLEIVALTSSKKVIMVRHWRYPIEEESLEIPCGSLDSPKESFLEAAKRELLEETGAESDSWFELGTYWASNGIMKNKGYIFLAQNCRVTSSPHPGQDEKMSTELLDFDRVVKMVLENDIQDDRTQLGVLLTKEFLKKRELPKRG